MRIALESTTRTCDGCTECCYALTVIELAKLEYTRCQHQGQHDCSIYADRPKACQEYSCLWLQGLMGEENRPDRWGLVLDIIPTTGGNRLRVWEMKPGAWDRPGIAWQIRKIAERIGVAAVVLWRYDVRSRYVGGNMAVSKSGTDTPWLEIAEPVW